MATRRVLLSWIPSVLVGGVLAFSGVMKLTSNPDAVGRFANLGGSPVLLVAGVLEVVAAVLILIPGTRIYGAGLAALMMLVAVGANLAVLQDGTLLILALVVLVASGLVAVVHRADVPVAFGPWMRGF